MLAISPVALSVTANVAIVIALNLFITGVFAFFGFAYPTSKIMPHSYYQIKNPTLLRKIYKLLGVHYFKIFLLLTFYRKKENKKYFNGTKSGLINFDYQTKQSEFGHGASFVVIQLISIPLLLKGHFVIIIVATIINVLFNFYPIILQRKHRMQLESLLLKMAQKPENKLN